MSSINGITGIYRQAGSYQRLGSATGQKVNPTVVTPVASVRNVRSGIPAESAAFLAQYQSKMDGMSQAASELRDTSSSAMRALTASTDNAQTPDVATTTTDNNKIADSIQKMVGSFNDSLELLHNNADRGAGVNNQMKRMLVYTGNGTTVDLAGISAGKSGELQFDRTKFLKSVSEDPSLAQHVVGGSIGLANNVYTAAQQGLRQSANSLLSEDLKTAKLQQVFSPSSLTASYNRNGAFAIGNYQNSGSLLNVLV